MCVIRFIADILTELCSLGVEVVACIERSCEGANAKDWIILGPEHETAQGLQRIEAQFASHGYDPHRHDTYSFGCTLSGIQSFDYRGARRDSIPGRSIVLHPDEVHDGRAGTDAGFHYRMLYVEPRLIQAALGARATALPFIQGGISDDPILSKTVAATLEDLSRPLEPLEIDQMILDLSEAILRLDSSARSARKRNETSLYSQAVETAREFLEAEAVRQVHSSELEEITGLERHELSRQFRRRLGTSPYRYLTLRRLTHAREKIGHGEALGEVAISCGFADQSHMTRAFGSAYGMAPGRWRQLLDAANTYSK